MIPPERQHQADCGISLYITNAIIYVIEKSCGMPAEEANIVKGDIHGRMQSLPHYPGLQLPSTGLDPSNVTTEKRRNLMQVLPFLFFDIIPGEEGQQLTQLCLGAFLSFLMACVFLTIAAPDRNFFAYDMLMVAHAGPDVDGTHDSCSRTVHECSTQPQLVWSHHRLP